MLPLDAERSEAPLPYDPVGTEVVRTWIIQALFP
jgi:hypothetical protein